MAFKTVALMNRISDAKTADYPGGLAYLIVQGLMQKYRPNDRISKIEALVELNKISMKADEEPDVLFNKVAAVRQTYRKSGIDDANYLNHIINSVPSEYQGTIAFVMSDKGNSLTIEHVQKAMNTYYRLKANKSKEGTSSSNEGETALGGFDKGSRKGLCYKCGKPGHKAYQCRSDGNGNAGKAQQGKSKFKGTCNNCGRQGHKVIDCWELEKNKDKRPKNWKVKTHSGTSDGAEAGAAGIEYCLLGMGFCGPCAEPDGDDAGNDTGDVIDSDEVARGDTGNDGIEPNEAESANDEGIDSNTNENAAAVAGATTYVGPVYDHDPYQTDTDQSVGSSSDDQDDDGHLPYENLFGDAFDELIANTDVNERIDPPRVYTLEEIDDMMGDDDSFDDGIDDEVINNTIAWRVAEHQAEQQRRQAERQRIRERQMRIQRAGDEKKEEKDGEAGLPATYTIKDIMNDKEIWIGDSGATTHTSMIRDAMCNTRNGNGNEAIVMGNGHAAKALTVGDIKGSMMNKDSKSMGRIVMEDVMHSSDAKFNLFSLPAMMKKGWILTGSKDRLELKLGSKSIVFDIVVDTPKGMLFCMRIKYDKWTEVGALAMSATKLHQVLGHGNEHDDKLTAKQLGIQVKQGALAPCEPCSAAKAKQKAVNKVSTRPKSTRPGEMLYLDISTIVPPQSIRNEVKVKRNNWRLIVDAATNLSFSGFFDTKDGMVEPTCELLDKWQKAGMDIKVIRCDNASENKALEARMNSSDWKLSNIKMEYTARDTPQQNSPVEKKFDTVYGKGRAMLNEANVTLGKQYLLGKEALLMMATLLDGLEVIVTLNIQMKIIY